MDIEEFYDADPRRRSGEDRQYGLGWSDAADEHSLWDLYWNSGSGELYLMRKPVASFKLLIWISFPSKRSAPGTGTDLAAIKRPPRVLRNPSRC